ncbi:response regulator [Sulfitobacter sp. LCG007]
MEKTDPFTPAILAPKPGRPLLGLTILVIEDSRFACEAIRLLCLRSGARIRRADCMRSARRHLQTYCPSVVIVDLGLPDGNGADLIRELGRTDPRVAVILGTSGDPDAASVALEAGADGFLAKPITSLAGFQEAVLEKLPPERQPSGPRLISDEIILPDRMAFHDDMAHIADVLQDGPDDHALDYAAQFLSGVARSAHDRSLEDAARALARKRAAGETGGIEAETLAGLVQQRLKQKLAI